MTVTVTMDIGYFTRCCNQRRANGTTAPPALLKANRADTTSIGKIQRDKHM